MLAVWAITMVPDTRNGGANGGGSSSCMSPTSARSPPPCLTGWRATSTYSRPASSSARRTNSPRPWMPGQ